MLSYTIVFSLVFFHIYSAAQPYVELSELEGNIIKTYYSPGNEERAKVITERVEKTINYIAGLVDFTPKVNLFMLSPEHWEKYATFPVYGMPHFTDDHKLVIASEDNPFWKSLIPPLDQLPADLAAAVKKTYTSDEERLTMRPFFDLLALHELGHAFHLQAGLTMHRLWMQELFCNIMLHTYIAENEPQNLSSLELFPEMVVAGGTSGYEFTTLAEFETNYGTMNPRNYGWYQCKLHSAAKDIYNAEGKDTFVKLWDGLKPDHGKLSDEQLAVFLNNYVSSTIAKVYTEWGR
jgi:hypothetical protein